MAYRLIIKKADEGGYIGIVPEIPGALTQGETEKEVRENIKEAINLLHETRLEMALKDLEGANYTLEELDL